MISAVIHLFLFEVQYIAGACNNTQAASLASFRIHYYGSMNFCHKRNSLKFNKVINLDVRLIIAKNTAFWGHSKQKCMIIYQQMVIFLRMSPKHKRCPARLQ